MTHGEMSPRYAYGLVREEYPMDGETRIAYGIAVYAHPTDTGSASIVTSIRDVTQDRAAIEQLILLCNEGGLSPAHLADVVDDFFGT